jgi:ABC-type nitrate/sulfonate/bicarbonate transport system substrate-binding protein
MGMFRRAALAWAAVALILTARPAWSELQTSLALPSVSPGFTAIYVAEDQGLWSSQGLSVKVTQIAGVGTINAVIAGSIDFSGSTAPTLIRAAVHGQKMTAIANLTDRLMDEVVLRKDVAARVGFDAAAPLATRAALLRGMTMAVDGINTINHGFLRYVVRKAGLDPDHDVTVAPMQASTMAAALASRAIDGFAVSQPWTTAVSVNGSAVILASVPGGDFPELVPFGGAVIVTRPTFCADKRAVCVAMGHGLAAASAFIHAHPQATLAILKKRFAQLDPATLAASFESYRAATPMPPEVTEAVLANSQKFDIDTGLTKPEDKLASFAGLFTDQFVH